MPRLDILDPLRGFKFNVEVDGFPTAGFDEVTGLEKTTEVIEHNQGGELGQPVQIRGRTKYSQIVMKRGQTNDSSFYDWSQDVHDLITDVGQVNYRREFDVVQFNEQGIELKRWRVYSAWPTKFVAATNLKGDSSEKSIEELHLTHQGWDIA